MPGIDESRQFVPLKIAVLTVSDTRERADDKSGNTLAERIRAAGHTLAERSIVKDEVKAIRQRVKDWIEDKFIDVVITTGGTGFTGRDVTPEAVEPLFEKKMDGFVDDVPAGERKEDRHLGDPDARHRRRRQRDLYFLPARLARRLQGRLGRDPGAPARLPLPAVQFRGDIAAARRAHAAAEGERRDGVARASCDHFHDYSRARLRAQPLGIRFVTGDRERAELRRLRRHSVKSQYSATTSSPQLCFFSLEVSVKPAFS